MANSRPTEWTPRAHQRFVVDIEATITADLGSVKAKVHDLSRGGISFYLPVPMEPDTTFTVEISLVFEGHAQSEALALTGRVVWCTKRGPRYQIGAAFLSVDPKTQELLQMFLDFIAGTAAA